MKFQLLVIKNSAYLRVIVFTNREDLLKIFFKLPNQPFSRLKYRHYSEIVNFQSFRFRKNVCSRYFILTVFINYLKFKVSNSSYKKMIYSKVVVFADCEDFEIAEFTIFSFEIQTIAVKYSTNAYINTVCQLTQQESKQVLKGIAKNCGIQTDLLVNMRNSWRGN